MRSTLGRRTTAELVGTALLVAAVVGSGVFAERLTDDTAIQLLASSLATAGALVALILAFGALSGAHFNPVVTLAERSFGGMSNREAAAYIPAQIAGGCLGAIVANVMFDLDPINVSTHTRTGADLWVGEVVATFGLLIVILGVVRSGRTASAPFAVAGYIGAAYWFTSSTSFANPAVTIARTLSDTFAGIDPSSVPAFITCQLLGGAVAIGLAAYLWPTTSDLDLVGPHEPEASHG